MSALAEQPATTADELEEKERAIAEIETKLTALGQKIDEDRDRYNALWSRLADVQADLTAVRRNRATGVEFAGGRLYHIEEFRREDS